MKHFAWIVSVFALSLSQAMAGEVQELMTPDGFRALYMEEQSLPIVTTHLVFKGCGLAHEPAEKEGRNNMVASLLLEGAGSRDSKAFNEALEYDAIRLDVATDDDAIYVTLETQVESQTQAFEMLSDILIRPRFDDEAIERARARALAVLVEQQESPNFKMGKAWQEMAYGAHPYHRTGLGTEKTLAALSRDDFKTFASHCLTKENIVISMVGAVTKDQAQQLLDTHLRDLPQAFLTDTEVASIEIKSGPETKKIIHKMPQTMVMFGLAGLKREDPDYIPAYVMNYILGGAGLNSILAQEIRVKRGLAYSVNSMLDPKEYTGVWRGMFATKNEEATHAIRVMKETLQRVTKEGVSKEQLQDAKDYLTGSFILNLDSNRDVARFLSIMQTHHLGSDYLTKRNTLVNQVTSEDIARVMNRIVHPEKLLVVTVGGGT